MIQVIPSMIPHILDLLEVHLGLGDKTKTDELLEKFQTPVAPPHLQKIMLQFLQM